MDYRQMLVCLALGFSVKLDFYSAVKIEISPQKVVANKDPVANITCTVDEKENKEASEIVQMKIARKGARVMVVLDSEGNITYVEATDEEVTSYGYIENVEDLTKSFLEMAILQPDTEDAGMYFCEVIYNVTSGDPKKSKSQMLLTVKAEDVSKMDQQVEDLLKQVKEEESAIKDMEQQEEQVKKIVPDLEEKSKATEKKIKDLASKESKAKKKVTEIEEKAMKQLKMMNELSKKEETAVKSLKSSVEDMLKKRQKGKDDMKEIAEKETKAKENVKKLEEDVEKKKKEIEDLDDKEKKVERKVNDLQINSKDALKKVKKFFKNKITRDKRVKEVEDKVDEKGTKLKDLKQNEDDLEKKIAEIEKKFEQAVKKFKDIDSKTDFGSFSGSDLDNSGPSKGLDTNPMQSLDSGLISAFAATTQESFIIPKKGSTLIFPDIAMQVGMEGYNKNTGIFTAPVKGLYHFSLSIKLGCIRCYTVMSIRAKGVKLATLRTGTYYDHDQNSVSTVAKLDKGTQVSIFNEFVSSKPDAVLTAWKLSNFSGHLIKAL